MPTTIDLDSVSAVLLRQLRANYPGITDVRVSVTAPNLGLDFQLGDGATPNGTRGLGAAAVGGLRTKAPNALKGISDVTVRADGQEDTYPLSGLESPNDDGAGPF